MIKIDGKVYEYGHFPDGTLNMKLGFCGDNTPQQYISSVLWLYDNQEEQIILYNIVKYMKSLYKNLVLELILPYVPNGRMDRTKNDNEIFTLKYFCEFINDLKFDKVYVLDPHSDVSIALLNNCQCFASSFQNETINDYEPNVLFFPDNGASKRYSDMFKIPYCYGNKNRDWETGNILGLDIVTNGIDLKDKKVLIVDDICSKGGTFYYSALELKKHGVKDIALSVSHCENSILEGEFGVFKVNLLDTELISKVYTTDSIFTKEHEKIKIIGEFRK